MANLEGDIVSSGKRRAENVVYNSRGSIEILRELGVNAVSLANNHVFDVYHSTHSTINTLKKHGIGSFGAGDSLSEARQPYFIRKGTPPVILLGFGWEPIQCRIASTDSPGVNPLTPNNVLNGVRQAKESYPEAKTVLYMHWNYELELYPQPMHRQLAFRAIDAGADAVVGTHSHRVQGIEVYRGAPIVHGLGNWLFAQNEYYDGTLSFPDCASLELAFEWRAHSGDMICHWFKYDKDEQKVSYINSTKLEKSKRIKRVTPYSGMEHNEYIEFFRHNRLKRKLLPGYYHCDNANINAFKNKFVETRSKMIRCMVRMGVKSASR